MVSLDFMFVQVGNNMQQFHDPFAPDWRDNAELGEVCSDRIDHRGLRTYEQMAGAVKHQAACCQANAPL